MKFNRLNIRKIAKVFVNLEKQKQRLSLCRSTMTKLQKISGITSKNGKNDAK